MSDDDNVYDNSERDGKKSAINLIHIHVIST